jgi:hypothetical protein
MVQILTGAPPRAIVRTSEAVDIRDWRLPIQDELAGLYDSNKSRQAACNTSYSIHVITGLIDITCFAPWASETRGSEAAIFGFTYGNRRWFPQTKDNRALPRALPVRSVK